MHEPHSDLPDPYARVDGHENVDREPSVLKNRDGVLHLDHFDSLVRSATVRSATVRGTLPSPAANLVRSLERDGDRLAFPPDAAEAVERLIVEEARLHGQAFDLAATAVLSDLVGRLLADGTVRLESLPYLTDAELSAKLQSHDATRDAKRAEVERSTASFRGRFAVAWESEEADPGYAGA